MTTCIATATSDMISLLRLTLYSFLMGTGLTLLSCQPERESPEPEPATKPTPYNWTKPRHFPEPVYDFQANPLTAEGVELGKFLFYDGILSRNGLIGCGTCHQQASAFTHHGHDLSHGVDDRLGKRNAQSVQNMAWSPVFFWDGGVHDLDFVPFNAIENEVEMDEKVGNVLDKLRKTPDYPRRFRSAFGSDEITTERMMKALSQFMLTMVSATSRYDYYTMGDASALNTQERQGLTLFKQHCSSCHSGELFTDHSFRNNGLRPLPGNDLGRYDVTQVETDRYTFKVPSLRNVGLSSPYMHDGRYYTLEEVLDHYTDSVFSSLTLDPILKNDTGKGGLTLSPTEKQAIIAFLKTLNDDQFIRDRRLSDPGIGNAF